jgi:hypothetical protein
MTTYAIIENGTVTNVIEWDGNAENWQAPEGAATRELAPDEIAGIGYSFDAAADVFTAPPSGPAAPATIPTQVTMRQARLALLAAGKLKAVSDAIATLPSPQKDAAQIEWDYAATVDRSSPFLASLASMLELDSNALDALFTAAAQL